MIDPLLEQGQVVGHRRPDRLRVDVEIIVNKDVSHTYNLKPRDIRMAVPEFIRGSRSRFPEYL